MNLHNDLKNYRSRFDQTYFEHGIKAGVSLYENYRWMPQRTMPMARQLKAMFPGKSVIDFGCAKGFLVRALRCLSVDAWGIDISRYALSKAPSDAKPFLFENIEYCPPASIVFAKDTLEHIPYQSLCDVLRQLSNKAQQAMFIVPFGDQGKYRIAQYHQDVTHIIAESEGWWLKRFEDSGYYNIEMHYHIPGFKDNWKEYHRGNGFFIMRS